MSYAGKLLSLRPGAEWGMTNVLDYDTLTWIGPGEAPTKAELDAYDPPPPVPEQVTNAQARIALILTPATDDQYPHLLAQAEAVFDALPEPDRSIALARMEYDTHWPRQSDLVTLAKAALGLTDAQVDDLFRLAATK